MVFACSSLARPHDEPASRGKENWLTIYCIVVSVVLEEETDAADDRHVPEWWEKQTCCLQVRPLLRLACLLLLTSWYSSVSGRRRCWNILPWHVIHWYFLLMECGNMCFWSMEIIQSPAWTRFHLTIRNGTRTVQSWANVHLFYFINNK